MTDFAIPSTATLAARPIDPNACGIAVQYYLVAKECGLEWKAEFHRACADLANAKALLRAIEDAGISRVQSQGHDPRIGRVLDRGIGWNALPELLAYTARKRRGRKHNVPTVEEITKFLNGEYWRQYLEATRSSTKALLEPEGWIHQIDGDRLSAADAGKVLAAWRDSLTVEAKRRSDRAAAAKMEDRFVRGRRLRAEKEAKRLAKRAASNAGMFLVKEDRPMVDSIAVLGYLIAKEYDFEWKADFHRACDDQTYTKKVFNLRVQRVTARVSSEKDLARLPSVLQREIGWSALHEMLNVSFRRRTRGKEEHRVFNELEVTGFLRREFGPVLSDELARRLTAGELAACDAAEILGRWRSARGDTARIGSKAAAKAKRKLEDQAARRLRFKVVRARSRRLLAVAAKKRNKSALGEL